ncbi:MAG: PAS domain-containing sensor histidine kinase [Candidatus Melainabacteria bacterium]|nr:PAS domain-containing sensor histidine kinase [Candidatus Melainabacteria bacterium]
MSSSNSKEQAQQLAKLRAEVERITQEYIDTLIDSEDARAHHADFLMTILDSIGDGLVVYDCNENVILANQAAAKMAGMTLFGKDKTSIRESIKIYRTKNGPPLPHEEEPFFHALSEKESCEKEAYLEGNSLRPDGMWLRAHAAPVLDKSQNLLGVVSTFCDISERKKLQNERDALASMIAHDIKNHLAGEEMILNYLKNNSNELNEKARDAIDKMSASNRHHLELAGSLLEIFRTDFMLNTNNSVELDFKKIFEVVLFLNSLFAATNQVEIKTEIEPDLPSVKGVPAAIRHTLHNVLQNAIKMSKKGSSVTLAVKKSNNKIKVTVSDSGVGMSKEQVSKLFDPLTVAKKIPTDVRSSGVGLYFSKLLLDAHNATISCQSKEGAGTTVTIEFPGK